MSSDEIYCRSSTFVVLVRIQCSEGRLFALALNSNLFSYSADFSCGIRMGISWSPDLVCSTQDDFETGPVAPAVSLTRSFGRSLIGRFLPRKFYFATSACVPRSSVGSPTCKPLEWTRPSGSFCLWLEHGLWFRDSVTFIGRSAHWNLLDSEASTARSGEAGP